MKAESDVLSSGEWIPYRIKWDGVEPEFQWLFIGSKKISEPFFEETLITCYSLPENREKVTCDGSTLLRIAENGSGVETAAIIFHVSRCGSTLLSQLLVTDESNTVLSEVPILDELLKYSRSGHREALLYYKAVVTILGRRKNSCTERTFVKLDSWHLGHYNELRKMYSNALFVFLTREPGAVVRSHNRQAGIQSVQGTAISELLFTNAQLNRIPAPEYLSSVLAKYYAVISQVVPEDRNSIVHDYSEGILPLVERMYAKCSIVFSDNIRKLMEERLKFHSKRKQDVFSESETVATHLRLTEEATTSYCQMRGNIRTVVI